MEWKKTIFSAVLTTLIMAALVLSGYSTDWKLTAQLSATEGNISAIRIEDSISLGDDALVKLYGFQSAENPVSVTFILNDTEIRSVSSGCEYDSTDLGFFVSSDNKSYLDLRNSPTIYFEKARHGYGSGLNYFDVFVKIVPSPFRCELNGSFVIDGILE